MKKFIANNVKTLLINNFFLHFKKKLLLDEDEKQSLLKLFAIFTLIKGHVRIMHWNRKKLIKKLNALKLNKYCIDLKDLILKKILTKDCYTK